MDEEKFGVAVEYLLEDEQEEFGGQIQQARWCHFR
jgi:hypothetical protein